MILETFCTGPVDTNSTLLACSSTLSAAIIDAAPESAPFFIEKIEKLGLHVKMILLTHTHADHIADVSILKKQFNVPIYVHREDAANLEKPGSDGIQLPIFPPIQGVKPDHYLEDRQMISLGNLSLEVLHTPGHSPGCVCFYLKNEKVLISGDTLFKGTIGALHLPTAEPNRMWPSLKKLAKLPPDTVVYPGHGEKTTIGDEAWIVQAQELFNMR